MPQSAENETSPSDAILCPNEDTKWFFNLILFNTLKSILLILFIPSNIIHT